MTTERVCSRSASSERRRGGVRLTVSMAVDPVLRGLYSCTFLHACDMQVEDASHWRRFGAESGQLSAGR